LVHQGSIPKRGDTHPVDRLAEPGSFPEVFDEHARFVWRSLLGLGVAESDVPDASQQVFVVLHQKLSQLNQDCALRTFLYGICLRTASDFRRRGHRRREELRSRPPEVSVAATQEASVAQRQALAALELALDELSDQQRAVFVLYELQELSMTEVALTLDCPLQTAYSRLHAARKVVYSALAVDRETGE
jgi:RNA polymerase sigma-70 factor (ECF subfamily)